MIEWQSYKHMSLVIQKAHHPMGFFITSTLGIGLSPAHHEGIKGLDMA